MPDNIPNHGERIFADMTPERAREIAEKRIKSFKGTPYEITDEDRKEVIWAIMDEYMTGPMLVEV